MANVNVTYQEMQSQAQRLVAGKQDIEDRLHTLQNEVQQLVAAGFVTDSASGQFESSYTEFTNGAKQVIDGLDGMSNYLNKAAAAFQSVDAELAKALN
jgi:WXG100 family type VII secretion target